MGVLIAIVIILILITIIIFEVFIACALKVSKKETIETEEKPKKVELTDEQKKKQEELRKNFENLMNYDYNEALKSTKGE